MLAAESAPRCRSCGGDGAMAGCHLDAVNACPACGGTGLGVWLLRTLRRDADEHSDALVGHFGGRGDGAEGHSVGVSVADGSVEGASGSAGLPDTPADTSEPVHTACGFAHSPSEPCPADTPCSLETVRVGQVKPPYHAACKCGFWGPPRDGLAEAISDARAHVGADTPADSQEDTA